MIGGVLAEEGGFLGVFGAGLDLRSAVASGPPGRGGVLIWSVWFVLWVTGSAAVDSDLEPI